MKRLAPGIYDDGDGGMHLDVPELLRANGWPDNAHNRAMVIASAVEVCRAMGIIVTETDDPLPPTEL